MSEKQYKLVKCTINGEYRATMVDVRASLTDMLRNDDRLTSVKKGCEVGEDVYKRQRLYCKSNSSECADPCVCGINNRACGRGKNKA